MKVVDLPETREIGVVFDTLKSRLTRLGLFQAATLLEKTRLEFDYEIDVHLLEQARQESKR